MILKLTVLPTGATVAGASRCTFDRAGGTIGRVQGNTLVLSDLKVSRCHARISCEGSDFYIEDCSVNGTFLNSRHQRLTSGRPQRLRDGDRILIDPYVIELSIEGHAEAFDPPPRERAPQSSPLAPGRLDDPFASELDDDPFQQLPVAPAPASLDPLRLLNLDAEDAPAPRPPRSEDLMAGDPFQDAIHVPAVAPSSPPPAARDTNPGDAAAGEIPRGYNPLVDDSQILRPMPARPMARPVRQPVRAPEPPPVLPDAAAPPPQVELSAAPSPVPTPPPVLPAATTPVPVLASDPEPVNALFAEPGPAPVTPPAPLPPTPPPMTAAPRLEDRAAAGAVTQGSSALAAVLQGAGLDPSLATDELGRQLGEILRVVVSEMMTLMESRVEAKEAFGGRRTRFMPAENNPLKFSVNVEDALHNLLVKRNPAYLGPVDAFRDAFADVKHHQLALLAGVRSAFEFMLGEFDPDRLEQVFDGQAGKALMPGKLRYWDQYRQRLATLAQDSDARFETLFGDAFARAYNDEIARARSGARARRVDEHDPSDLD